MAGFRWWRFCCLALILATMPMQAQEQPSPAPPPHAIPDGVRFLIRLEDKLDVSRVQPGKRFKAKLAEDLVGPDETMIPRGSTIRGHVSDVGNGFHPRLLLSFDEIETHRGWAPLMATVIDLPGEHGLTTREEGEIQRQGQGGGEHRDPDSGGMGSKTGAAAGVVRAIFSDHRLQLQKGTMLEVRLDHPLQVPWR
ncbi:MAG: hypothetical protein ACRD20_14540 [Terriglobales bacterium]